jgi:hypothetical protein
MYAKAGVQFFEIVCSMAACQAAEENGLQCSTTCRSYLSRPLAVSSKLVQCLLLSFAACMTLSTCQCGSRNKSTARLMPLKSLQRLRPMTLSPGESSGPDSSGATLLDGLVVVFMHLGRFASTTSASTTTSATHVTYRMHLLEQCANLR